MILPNTVKFVVFISKLCSEFSQKCIFRIYLFLHLCIYSAIHIYFAQQSVGHRIILVQVHGLVRVNDSSIDKHSYCCCTWTLNVTCCVAGCSDLAMILCDSQAVEVLCVTIMKTLQQCATSDLLPRVSIANRETVFHWINTDC